MKIIRVTNLRSSLSEKSGERLREFAPMLPQSIPVFLDEFGLGNVSGEVSFTDPAKYHQRSWNLEFGNFHSTFTIQIAHCASRFSLDIGSDAHFWGHYEGEVHFVAVDLLEALFALTAVPELDARSPDQLYFVSDLDRLHAATQKEEVPPATVAESLRLVHGCTEFRSRWNACFHFEKLETLVELGNFYLDDDFGAKELSVIYNPSTLNERDETARAIRQILAESCS